MHPFNLLQLINKSILIFLAGLSFVNLGAQDRSFYAGNSGNEAFYDVVQLSDGTFIIAGTADDLDWLPMDVNLLELDVNGISNNQGSNKIGFILQTDQTLENILNVVFIPAGGVEDIRFIKTTNEPRKETGDMYISGNTEDASEGGFFIGKLDNNFVNGSPSGFEWTYNVKCKDGDYPKLYHPWDVDSQGRVYFIGGDSHDWDWESLGELQPVVIQMELRKLALAELYSNVMPVATCALGPKRNMISFHQMAMEDQNKGNGHLMFYLMVLVTRMVMLLRMDLVILDTALEAVLLMVLLLFASIEEVTICM